MKPNKQKIYLPVKVEDELPEIGMCKFMFNEDNDFVSFLNKNGKFTEWFTTKNQQPTHWLKPQEAFVFSSEQLNEYTQNVIKQALEAAAEKALCDFDEGGCTGFVDEKSITNTFEETFNKFKVW